MEVLQKMPRFIGFSILLYFLLIQSPAPFCSASRILVLYAVGAKTHLLSMLPVIRRLEAAGHSIHVLHVEKNDDDDGKFLEQLFPQQHPHGGSSNVTVERIKLRQKIAAAKNGISLIWHRTMSAIDLAGIYDQRGDQFDELVNSAGDKLTAIVNSHPWDMLLVSEMFNFHGYAIVQMLPNNGQQPTAMPPVVLFCTSMMLSSTAYQRALGQNWVTNAHRFSPTPEHKLDGFKATCFTHRLRNTIESFVELFVSIYIDLVAISPRLAKFTGKLEKFGLAGLHEMSTMTISDSTSIGQLGFAQPISNGIYSTAACNSEVPNLNETKFAADYRNFLDDPLSKGTIYIAFGTFISRDLAPPGLLGTFLEVFERFPNYRFIFALRQKQREEQKMPMNVSAHIRIVQWAPQVEILAHQKTRLFITHCGLKSIKEAICHGVPMLAMPMYAEQNYNARLILKLNIGLLLNKFKIDADEMERNMQEIFQNSLYTTRAGKLQRILADRTDLDKAVSHMLAKIVTISSGKNLDKKAALIRRREIQKRFGAQLHSIQYFHIDLAILMLILIATL